MECAPAFDYARARHKTELVVDDSIPDEAQKKVVFTSSSLTLDLRYVVESVLDGVAVPEIKFESLDLQSQGHLGLSVCAEFELCEGQVVTFVLRTPPKDSPIPQGIPRTSTAEEYHVTLESIIEGANKLRARDDPVLTTKLANGLLQAWHGFTVHRSALALKLLIFEPTGVSTFIIRFWFTHGYCNQGDAIVASPTFSLPEFIGGTRNWDYRYSWVRDSSFTLYALIRLGFTDEANEPRRKAGQITGSSTRADLSSSSLQIMYTIHGGKNMQEIELDHLLGHKDSRPVRIGNGAADHLQLDIYGELLDFVYLSQKFARPLGYDMWLAVRDLVDYVVANCHRPDLSIWEVRNKQRHFTYSKIMMWVAIDRGLRLAEKRQLPLSGRRQVWLDARDALYEEIQEKAWNPKRGIYAQANAFR
ncbi:hypothetical protein FRC17_010500 [Serendipita sp. 399]|nr:hypothetical protein FRC17_010500 [Serendipita sp. 399]